MLTLGTGIGGGLVLGGQLQRGWIGGGAELGHMVVDMDGPPCRAMPQPRLPRGAWRPAARWCARRRCGSRGGPDAALGHALEEGRELTGPFVTELAHDGDPVARDAIEPSGARWASGSRAS